MSFHSQAVSKARATRTGKRKPIGRFTARSKTNSINKPEPIVAKEAGLRYVTDATPGIHRQQTAGGFLYRGVDGKTIRDEETLSRIRALAIPPAWTDVWICPSPLGHLQATGRDARKRKQYKYHPKWREAREQAKYERMIAFGRALPKLRRRVERDLARPGLSRDKLLATIVRLLETTLIRVGNEEYARQNNSFGLTTMKEKHATVNGSKVRFEFRGKSGIRHAVDLHDRQLARITRKCQDLPGEELFQYIDADGARHPIGSQDVNDYLRRITRQDFTAKDFRTWAGTLLAAQALAAFQHFDSQAHAKRNIVRAIESVAKRLGNTPIICRKCYVHPEVIAAYQAGTLTEVLEGRVEGEIKNSLHHLSPEEAAVLAFLQQRLNVSPP